MNAHITEREYVDECLAIAQIALDIVSEYGEDLQEQVSQDVDSHQWIIYTAYHTEVLRLSSNSNALFDDLGVTGLDGCTCLSDVTIRLAYYAMLADVNDALAKLQGEP